jgi:cytochrome b pre-mRNA-processing protein 3
MSRAQPSPPGAGGLEGRRLPLATLLAWRERLRARRAARAARQAAAERLYRDLVGVARAPRFFREIGVPDTPEGRFEMIGLHAALVLLRLRREGAEGRALGQALFDLMMADVDQNLRELGVGDLSVGKQVKRLAGQFYARLHALDTALGDGAATGGAEADRLRAALCANVWLGGPEPSADQVASLADHLLRCRRRLDQGCASGLLQGEAAFDGPAA